MTPVAPGASRSSRLAIESLAGRHRHPLITDDIRTGRALTPPEEGRRRALPRACPTARRPGGTRGFSRAAGASRRLSAPAPRTASRAGLPGHHLRGPLRRGSVHLRISFGLDQPGGAALSSLHERGGRPRHRPRARSPASTATIRPAAPAPGARVGAELPAAFADFGAISEPVEHARPGHHGLADQSLPTSRGKSQTCSTSARCRRTATMAGTSAPRSERSIDIEHSIFTRLRVICPTYRSVHKRGTCPPRAGTRQGDRGACQQLADRSWGPGGVHRGASTSAWPLSRLGLTVPHQRRHGGPSMPSSCTTAAARGSNRCSSYYRSTGSPSGSRSLRPCACPRS